MTTRRFLPFVVLGIPIVTAAEIRWTASGTVSGLLNTGFGGSAAVGDPVEIVMVYDSATTVEGRSFLPIGGAVAGRAWFHGAADLAITVKIGEIIWRGEMPTVPAGENVMESLCWDGGGEPDWFKVTLDAARGGTFPDFPYSGTESPRALEIEFRDDQAPAGLFTVHQLPGTLSCLPEMTSASGAVRAGSDAILFSLDVATVRVSQPQVPVAIALVSGNIRLTWDSESGKSYRLDSTADLQCWIEEGRFSGSGNPIQYLFNPFFFDARRFYRVVEN